MKFCDYIVSEVLLSKVYYLLWINIYFFSVEMVVTLTCSSILSLFHDPDLVNSIFSRCKIADHIIHLEVKLQKIVLCKIGTYIVSSWAYMVLLTLTCFVFFSCMNEVNN